MFETEKIVQHRHCFVCGKVFAGEGRFCGDACKDTKKAELKKKKRQLIIIEVAAIALMAVAVIAML